MSSFRLRRQVWNCLGQNGEGGGDRKSARQQKLLGMEKGRNPNFDDYVPSLYKKAGRKLTMLTRLSKFLSLKANPYESICRPVEMKKKLFFFLAGGLGVYQKMLPTCLAD